MTPAASQAAGLCALDPLSHDPPSGTRGWIVLHARFQSLVKFGRLTIIGPSSRKLTFCAELKANTGPDDTARAVELLTLIKLALHPDLHFGEAYMSRAEGER